MRRGLAVGSLVLWLVLAAAPAHAADGGVDGRFVELANAARGTSSLAGYATAGDLADVAGRHAAKMAAEHRIFHNPNLGRDVDGWQQVGENVGVGEGPDQLHQGFMQSPTHRANIMSSSFREIGIGTVVGDDGRLYVVQVFRLRQPAAAPAPAPKPVAATPKPAAPPAAKPAPVKAAAPTPPTAPAAPAPAPDVEAAPAPIPVPVLEDSPGPEPEPVTSPVSVASAHAGAAARVVTVSSTTPSGSQRPALAILAGVLAVLAGGLVATQLPKPARRWSLASLPAAD
jgi:hypothetical protein